MVFDPDATWAARAAKAVLLIRVLVGWVFLSEGIQKFLYPDALGVGRFVKIGIPWPQVMAPFVGVVEIICGALLLIGLMTRFATVALLIDIGVALYSTKIATCEGWISADRFREAPSQSRALDILHNQKNFAHVFQYIVNPGNVGMVERGGTLRLLQEAFEIGRIRPQPRRHALDRDAPFQNCVFRRVDLTHAAGSKPIANHESADGRARQIVGNGRVRLVRWLCHEEVTRRKAAILIGKRTRRYSFCQFSGETFAARDLRTTRAVSRSERHADADPKHRRDGLPFGWSSDQIISSAIPWMSSTCRSTSLMSIAANANWSSAMPQPTR